MTIRYRFPDELTYEITSADLAADWLLLQKAGEKKVGKAHPSVIGVGKSDTNPVALGTAAPGTGTSVSRADHKHPTTGIGGSLVPSTDSTYDLGTASLSWRDLYIAATGHVWLGSTTAGLGGGSGAIYFQTGSTVRCAVDSSGHFAPFADNSYDLGTASLNWRSLYVDGSGYVYFGSTTSGVGGLGGAVVFRTGSTSRCSVDTSGHFVPSADNTYNLGSSTNNWRDLYLDATGHIYFGTSATGVAASGGQVYFQNSNTVRCGINTSGHFVPNTDNLYSCGRPNPNRWADVYAVNGTIQTSDATEKEAITDSDLGLDFINALRPVSYRWKVGGKVAVPAAKEGDPETFVDRPGVRRHYGLLAQDVKTALGNRDFGGYIYDQESDSYGLRYSQFIAPLVKAVQELTARIEALEGARSAPPDKPNGAEVDLSPGSKAAPADAI
jgi:hypothetical protein